jgi:hypothetical protein
MREFSLSKVQEQRSAFYAPLAAMINLSLTAHAEGVLLRRERVKDLYPWLS